MKKGLSVIMMFSVWAIVSQAQPTTLAKWSFPNGTPADSLPDLASINNATKSISAQGGTSAIDFTKNGATTKAAQATGWDNGKDVKYWQIEINSLGFKNLTLSSKINTGGLNAGPRDFKIQYKVGLSGTWADINSAAFKTGNDWTTGELANKSLPSDCYNQSSVYIRWIMTSDTSNNASLITSTGICKIDDIIITGETTVSIDGNNPETVFLVYPNPSTGTFTILNKKQTKKIEIYTTNGQQIYECLNPLNDTNIDLSAFGKGIYILKSGSKSIQRIIIR